ncbi:hypothetical protein [Cellulomonas dongxiuzhuiae]|uniref:Secreted protein n=1 Tax=Cellulomonas dongxiuzhuiae TaxID=2819979 RepID=A0ABX8GPN4_9CELL|nr:hypothetical protein [Cellulomonas dongxiuzhuiae]MBO3095877.1 hypothetical protein [Cellulomonas dongxiuzhuiae]QWC17179.1 hypothetical protein KKR89_06160 [Cellulomonas dongxiuzhuiae]
MKRALGWTGISLLVAGAAVAVLSGGPAVADAEVQSSLVEDFAFPGADEILAEHGLRLYTGDGHVEFVPAEDETCSAGLIRVTASLPDEPYRAVYCFKTSGARGFLTMEVPNTFLVRAAAVAVQATAVVPEEGAGGDPVREVYEVPANRAVSIEAGSGADAPPAVLVELRFGDW